MVETEVDLEIEDPTPDETVTDNDLEALLTDHLDDQ